MTERAAGETPMSDPGEATQANPHPISQHRTPREIALDEAGPIGQPDRDVSAQKAAGAERTRHTNGPRRADTPEKKADIPGKKRKR
ncbi:MAG: hypothetical protein ACXU9O_03435 [Gemmatimonadaceae bacterium]